MTRRATDPVAEDRSTGVERRAWKRAVVTRRQLHADEEHVWVQPAEPADFVTLLLCTGALRRTDGGARHHPAHDPAFIVHAGGSIRLRAASSAVIFSVTTPVQGLAGHGPEVVSVSEPGLSAPVLAFVRALLDATAADGGSATGTERVLTEIAEQLMLVGAQAGERISGNESPSVSY